MAKKVRKDGERKEEKKVVFEAPEFDEREYLEEQLNRIRLSLFFTAYAIPFGAIGAYLGVTTGNGWLGVIVAIIGFIGGVYLMRIMFDTDVLEGPKMQVIGTAGVFIITYLAVAILLSNPPINDPGDPAITDVMVYVQRDDGAGDWEPLMMHKDRLPGNDTNKDRFKAKPDQRYFLWNESLPANPGDNLSILVRAADAAGLKGIWISYGYGEILETQYEMERLDETRWDELETGDPYDIWGEHYYEVHIQLDEANNLYYRITVEDVNGHTTVYETEYEDTVAVQEP
jgi:hypothetical protein